MVDYQYLIESYLTGSELMVQAIEGMSERDLDSRPIPGQWSSREVIAHIADFEAVYVDRMKRVIAEENPTLLDGDPGIFASNLSYLQRNVHEEIEMTSALRRHMTTVLKSLPEKTFQKTGNHSVSGQVTLVTLLKNITDHIPHHIKFVKQKREALGLI